MDTYHGVPDGNQLVADEQPTVDLGGAAVHHLGDVDAVVARDVLIANAAGDAETEALVTLHQLDVHQPHVRRLASPPDTLEKEKLHLANKKRDWVHFHACYKTHLFAQLS